MLPEVEELPDDWRCECGNDKVSSRWSEKFTNIQIFECSECGKDVAKRIW